jgi:hypothetical protein
MQQQDLLKSNQYNGSQNLPNATASLVLGIISIVGAFCYGIVGLICGIIGLILANKDRKLYLDAPDLYSSSSFSTTNAGRTCSIIGLIISGLFIVLIIVWLVFVGTMLTTTGVFK